MAKSQHTVALPLPVFMANKFELAEGYEFGEPEGGLIPVFQGKQGCGGISCTCTGAGGSCNANLAGRVATCESSTVHPCTGTCSFVSHISDAAFLGFVTDVFRSRLAM